MMSVTTYADGFGRWHAEVVIGNNAIGDDNAAETMARDAIRKEIHLRNHYDVLHGVALMSRVSRDGTLTYHYAETDPE